MRRPLHFAIALMCVISFAVAGTDAVAKKGGGGGNPPGGEPPADPAIAYLSGTKLMVMNADGSNQTVLLDVGRQSVLSEPDWSPDGSRLVFASDVQGPGIYTINADGTGLARIVSTSSSFVWWEAPAWSPAPVPGVGGGRYRIAYLDHADTDLENEIFLVDVDGSNRVQVTNTPSQSEHSPTWSPSATRLACSVLDGQPGGMLGLYDFSADSYTSRRIDGVLAGVSIWEPNWSKTQEDKLAWSALGDIWIVDLDDVDHPVRLTDTPDVDERWMGWSPDDSHLVTGSRGRKGAYDVVSASDGTDRTRLASGIGGCAWRR